MDTAASPVSVAENDQPLVRLVSTNGAAFQVVQQISTVECNDRFTKLIGRFVDSPGGLSDILLDTGALLSGSLALRFGLPDLYASDNDCTPPDMDIYCPISRVNDVVHYLCEHENYNLYMSSEDFDQERKIAYQANAGIAEVYKLTKLGAM